MADARRDAVKCEDLQKTLRTAPKQAHTLTAAESAHVEACDTCLDAWLETMVTRTLDAKPEVQVPNSFVLRVMASLPARQEVARVADGTTHPIGHPWGLLTASALVAAGLFAAAAADPAGLATRMGAIFMVIVAAEVAGIALWLGMSHSGERRS